MLLLEMEVSLVHGQLDMEGGVGHKLVDANEHDQEYVLYHDEHPKPFSTGPFLPCSSPEDGGACVIYTALQLLLPQNKKKGGRKEREKREEKREERRAGKREQKREGNIVVLVIENVRLRACTKTGTILTNTIQFLFESYPILM